MLENGLGQACNQWNRKILSPTLSVAKLGQDEAENDQFLEVRYHSSASTRANNGSPLCEVLGHMHNSNLDLEAESDPSRRKPDDSYQKEAPESPSIPRDPFSLRGTEPENNNTNKGKPSQKTLASLCDETMFKSTPNDDSGLPLKDLSTSAKPPLARRSSSNDSDKLSVHVSHRIKKEGGDVIEETEKKQRNVESAEDSPLAHVNEITHIEAVQCGVLDLNAHLDSGENRISFDAKNDLSLDDTVNLTGSFETIEELDSPESIRAIDSEDCFSWEQDRLQLTLHDDAKEEAQDWKDVALTDCAVDSENSKPWQTKESSNTESSERESVSSDSTSTNTSIHSQVDLKEKASPNSSKKKALKNKLSAAFSKVGNKSKLKSSSDPLALKTEDGDVTLLQDKYGHPLAIFTNVSITGSNVL